MRPASWEESPKLQVTAPTCAVCYNGGVVLVVLATMAAVLVLRAARAAHTNVAGGVRLATMAGAMRLTTMAGAMRLTTIGGVQKTPFLIFHPLSTWYGPRLLLLLPPCDVRYSRRLMSGTSPEAFAPPPLLCGAARC